MRIFYLSAFLLLTLCCQSAGDSLIRVSYTIEQVKGHSTLDISVTFSPIEYKCDTCKSLFDKFFPQTTFPKNMYITDVWDRILALLLKNEALKTYIEIPDYIEEMIGLIKKGKKREQARQIYRQNNFNKVMSDRNSYHTTIINGKRTGNMEFGCSIYLLIKSPTKIQIPEQIFVYNSLPYRIAAFEIDLK